jgi:hypothetical protein
VWLCVKALCGLEEIMQNASTIMSGMKNRMWDRMETPSEEPDGFENHRPRTIGSFKEPSVQVEANDEPLGRQA